MKINKSTLEQKFSELHEITDKELVKMIDDAVIGVYDELKVLIEQMTCNNRMSNNYLCYEARFNETFSELRWLCFEKMMRSCNNSNTIDV